MADPITRLDQHLLCGMYLRLSPYAEAEINADK
jgi:hypothetical protein